MVSSSSFSLSRGFMFVCISLRYGMVVLTMEKGKSFLLAAVVCCLALTQVRVFFMILNISMDLLNSSE